MTSEEMHAAVVRLLLNIAPEVDPGEIQPNVNFRDQLDLDSVDLLNFIVSLHKEFGIEIPERDYPQLMSIDGCVTYLSRKLLPTQ